MASKQKLGVGTLGVIVAALLALLARGRGGGSRPARDPEPAPMTAPASSTDAGCDASYPDFCIPPPPPDLNCGDVRGPKPFHVRAPDPHGFDGDHDGWGCEPYRARRHG